MATAEGYIVLIMSDTGKRTSSGHHRPWLGASRIFAAELLLVPTGLVTAGVLTRQLGSAAYGEYVLALAAVAWVQYTATALLARATNRVVAAAEDWQPLAAEILRWHAFIGVVAALLVFVASPALANVLHQPRVVPVLRLLTVDVVLTVVVAGYRSVLVAMGEHAFLSMVSAARWIVRMVAIVGFVRLGWSITGAVAGIITSSAVMCVASAVRVGWLPRGTPDQRRSFRDGVFTVAAPTAIAAIFLRLFERGDVMLLSALDAPAGVLGEYGAAQNLTLVLGTLGATLAPIVLSSVTRHERDGDTSAVDRLVSDALRIPLLVLPFVGIGVGAAADIMALIYGEAFVGGAAPFAVLALGGCALLWFAITSALLIAKDRAWWVMAITAPMVPVLAALAVWLEPRYGGVGVAVASLVPAVAAAVVSLVVLARFAAARLRIGHLAVCLVLAFVAGGVAAFWQCETTLLRVVKLVVLSAAVAVALVLTGQVRVRGGLRLS